MNTYRFININELAELVSSYGATETVKFAPYYGRGDESADEFAGKMGYWHEAKRYPLFDETVWPVIFSSSENCRELNVNVVLAHPADGSCEAAMKKEFIHKICTMDSCATTGNSICVKMPARELWKEFGDVPMNPETECMESEWNGFPVGTFREDIWHAFEEEYDICVADLMYGGWAGRPTYKGMVRKATRYGYVSELQPFSENMVPVTKDQALKLFDTGHEVFLLHPDNTETAASSKEMIDEFGRDDEVLYGVEMESALDAFYEMLGR